MGSEDEEDTQVKKILDDAKDRRSMIGLVIERLVIIEGIMATLLGYYFATKTEEKHAFELLSIFHRELEFEQKLRVLKRLKFENRKGFHFDKKVYAKIQWLQEIRNAFAHNIKSRDEKSDKFKVYYRHEGKIKEITIDEAFIKNFERVANECEGGLFSLIRCIERSGLSTQQ